MQRKARFYHICVLLSIIIPDGKLVLLCPTKSLGRSGCVKLKRFAGVLRKVMEWMLFYLFLF